MIRGNRPDHLRPADVGWCSLFNGTTNGLKNHITGMDHGALVSVVESHRTESPLHHHLAEANVAGFQGNVGDPMHRHAGRHLHPQAGITRDGKKTLTDGSHVRSQLRLQGIDEDIRAQFNRLHMAVLPQQTGGFRVCGDNAACPCSGGVNLRSSDERTSSASPLPVVEAGETIHGADLTGRR